jgi:curved DNA-binding protein CbpA
VAERFVNYYEILGVAQDATAEQIKSAVKAQRGLWTPRQQSPSRELEREAQDQLGHIREAERTLLDPARRAAHDKAIAAYVPPEPERPRERGPDGGSGRRDWVAEAEEHLRRNRPEAAAGAAREATDREGGDHRAWSIRGRASLRMNQPDSAIFEFGEAVRIKPGSDEYHCDLGSAYESKHEYRRAIESYKTAQRLAPHVRRYPLSMASAYINSDEPERAVDLLIPLQETEPGDRVCAFLLAIALRDYSFGTWTSLGDGRRIITSAQQAAVTHRNMIRALELPFDDDGLRDELVSFRDNALAARRNTFRLPGMQVARGAGGGAGCLVAIAYFIAFSTVMGLAASNPIVGLPVLAGAGFGWYKLAFKPRWQRNAEDLRAMRIAPVTPIQGGTRAR